MKQIKGIFLCLFLTITQLSFAQEKAVIQLVGYKKPYILSDNKIYEDTFENPAKLIATIRCNRIYAGASQVDKDVLYTVVDGRVYKTAKVSEQNLLCYIKGNEIMLRKKQGGFTSGGVFSSSMDGGVTLLGFIEPLEYFALRIKCKVAKD